MSQREGGCVVRHRTLLWDTGVGVDLGFSSEEAGEPGGFQKRRDWCDVCPNWSLSCGL